MTVIRRAGLAVVALAAIGGLAGCGSGNDQETTTPAGPPPTSGMLPWGGDLQGFGDQRGVRCDGDDQAVRMAWEGDSRFLICRTAGSGERYLRAWTVDGPGKGAKMALFKGKFYTLTSASLQFDTEPAARFDIGPNTVTIEWPSESGQKSKFTSILTGPGWSRLD